MNGRQRFEEVMRYGTPDRVPYFEEGIRKDVIRAWQSQGLPVGTDLASLFPTDHREEITPDLDPLPRPKKWPTNLAQLSEFRHLLDAENPHRLPADWSQRLNAWRKRDHVVMLRIHRGFFQTVGIQNWQRFETIMYLLMDKPDFVKESMALQGEFAAKMAERILGDVEVDAVIFSEPIGGNDRPLISPNMYENFVLRYYEPILNVIQRHGVKTIIFRTYANARLLIPSILNWGFNCLWACEVNIEAMDYNMIRSEFGRDLLLIGGIDTDLLRGDKRAIKSEIEKIVPPLLADGGYIPLADGRIRADVPFENYRYYRQLLEEITTG